MNIEKYKKPLILFVIYVVLFSILSLIIHFGMKGAPTYPYLPGATEGIQVFIMSIIVWPIISIPSAIIGGYIFSPLFLVLYKKIIGRKLNYGLQDTNVPEAFKKTFQGFFPSLMALNLVISFLLVPAIMDIVAPLSMFDQYPQLMQPIYAILILLVVTMMLSMALFSAV